MVKTKPKCYMCPLPGEYEGIMYRVGAGGLFRMRKIIHRMCEAHFMENTFGLWPFGCTPACAKRRTKATGILLEDADLIIWVKMETVIRVNKPKDAVEYPKCPWCSKPMQSMPPETFARKKKTPPPKKRQRGSKRSVARA